MSYPNWTQVLRNHGYLDPVTRQCIGDKCYAKVDIKTGILGCGHAVCQDCQNLAIVNHQPEDVAVKFYKDMRNFYGHDEVTGMGDLAAVSSCLKGCTLAVSKDIVTKVPPCPEHIKSFLIWDRMLRRIAKHRGSTATNEEEETRLSSAYQVASLYTQPLATTKVSPMSAKNTIHVYEPGLIDFTETILANVDKLMLFQVRPKDHATSAHALYIWAYEQQPGFRPHAQHSRYLLVGADFDKVFDWDKSLGEEFGRNQVIYTEIPF